MSDHAPDPADAALQQISLLLGGTDEWTDRETMIAYVVDRVKDVAQAAPNPGACGGDE